MTVQVLPVKEPVEDVAWVGARARVEAGWADRLQQDRAGIAFVRTVEQRLLMLQGNLVMQRTVRSVVQK